MNVTIPSARGTAMAATIDFPDSPPVAYALFAHCFTCSRHVPAASRVCRTLAEHGIAALRFDFPGLGQSEGEFGQTTFTTDVDDIVAAARWLTENYAAPQLLLGHSLGGAAALKAATRPEMSGLRGVVTLGAPFDPAHAILHLADHVRDAEETGCVTVTLAGRDFEISREFLADLRATRPDEYLAGLETPLLVIHSPHDHVVSFSNATEIVAHTPQPTSLLSLDDADHLFTRGDSARRAGRLIAEWVRPYLSPLWSAPDVPVDEVTSHVAAGTAYGVVVNSAAGELLSDRPRVRGGRGLGHSPIDLLMASIAAASTQAARDAAAGMDLEDIHVTLRHASRNVFERRIEILGGLSDAQRRTLLDAARSSVYERMLSGVKILDVAS